MAGKWGTATIEDVAEKVGMGPFGSSIKVETFVSDGVPIIGSKHLHKFKMDDAQPFKFITPDHAQRLANSNVVPGDIILTHRGSIGQVSYIPQDSQYTRYVISQSQFYMRCDRTKVMPEYVTMYFKSPEGQHQLLANTSQVGVPAIAQPVTYLRTIVIPLPPLEEQRRIAHILGTLEDTIELNRRMNATLESMARALFKSWFVDFKPVRAKMEGRWRRGESLPGMPAELYDLFPDRLVPSEPGEMPEGWEVKAIEEIVNINPESWSRSNSPFEVKYVDLANTKWGTIQIIQHHLWADAPSRARRILRPGDTIMSTVRPGNGSYALIGEEGLTGSTGFAVLRPSEERFREITYLACTSKENVEWLAHLADGGAYPAIRPEVVGQTRIVIPVCDGALVNCFSSFIAPLFAKATSNNIESSTTSALRDSLLPKLMSGKANFGDG